VPLSILRPGDTVPTRVFTARVASANSGDTMDNIPLRRRRPAFGSLDEPEEDEVTSSQPNFPVSSTIPPSSSQPGASNSPSNKTSTENTRRASTKHPSLSHKWYSPDKIVHPSGWSEAALAVKEVVVAEKETTLKEKEAALEQERAARAQAEAARTQVEAAQAQAEATRAELEATLATERAAHAEEKQRYANATALRAREMLWATTTGQLFLRENFAQVGADFMQSPQFL
ncbi:Unknown protein, partial [Striga hermonthica]